MSRQCTIFVGSVCLAVMVLVSACGSSAKQPASSGAPTAATQKPQESAAKGPIVYAGWGGTMQDAQKRSWADTFTEKTGIKVTQDGPTDYGKFKAMVQSGNVQWDVVDVEGDFAYRAAKEGLLEPLDFSVIDKSKLDPRYVFDQGIGDYIFSFVNARVPQVGAEGKTPKGWADFFNVSEFPGKRTLYKWPTAGVLEMALLADGVTPDKLYPLDVDRALRKLDRLKPNVLWWETGAQSQQLLSSGEAKLGFVWSGRMYSLISSGVKIDLDWTQNIATAGYLVVPKGTKNKAAAMQFIAHALTAKPQADFGSAVAYSSINADAVKLLDAKVAPYLPSSHADTQIAVDYQYWADHGDEIAAKWNAWLLKK